MRSKFYSFLMCLLFATTTAMGYETTITSGSYYRLVSTAYNSERVMTDNNHFVTTAEKNTSDYLQLWKITASGNGYTLQNAVTGNYIQTSPGTSTQFHTGSSTAVFYTKKSSTTGFAFDSNSSFSGYGAIHRASGGNVVGWSYDATASYWYIEQVTVTTTMQNAINTLKNKITLKNGSIYTFGSYYDGRSLASSNGKVAAFATNASSYNQMWQLEIDASNATRCALKNLLTDEYIQTSPGTSVQYTTGSSVYYFEPRYQESSGSYTFTFKNTSGNASHGLHCAQSQSYTVVGWDYTAAASYWKVSEVTLTSAQQTELANIKAASSQDYTTQLQNFFEDYACTTLKSNYASMTDAQLRSAMSALPAAIQNMAVCVKNNTWNSSKGTTWNNYEKDFRIHSYEIFSNCDLWHNKLNIGRFSHLFHPTGVKVAAGDFIYLYVGDDVADSNASLEAEIVPGTDREGTAFTLHKGYNAVYATTDGEVFISYLLNNVNKQCANYPDITVHIEGGTMNGCFDMRGHGHTNDDWAWLKQNMFTDTYLHVKGNSVLLNVYRSSVIDESNAVGVMNIWDFIFDKLQSLSGCDSYTAAGTYKMMVNPFDNGTTGTNPFWNNTNHGSSHPGITSSGLFNYSNLSNIDTNGGQIWEIAHEIAHGHQTPVNLAGQTESSNNSLVQCLTLLAKDNIGTNMFQSTRSSRGEGVKALVSRFNSGYSWIDMGSMRTQSGAYSDLWLSNKLIYQLWLYFDYLGNYQPSGGNTGFSFISALYDRMRASGLVHSDSSTNPGLASKDYLLLAQYAAEITQTDLSEFFEVWGFWKLAPTVSNTNDNASSNTWFMGDYYGYYVKTDQSYVDAVKNAMKSYTKKGGNIMFIEDRCTGSPLATYDGKDVSTFGETGYFETFSQKVTTPYSFTTSYTGSGSSRTYNVTMSAGTGAVGFKVYDASGNLVAISNTKTFAVSQAIYNGLRNGTYTVKAAQGDGVDVATGSKGVNFILKFGDTVISEEDVLLPPGSDTQSNIPVSFTQAIPDLGDWITVTCDPATTTSSTTQVNVNVVWSGPFQFSTSYANAKWYDLNGHASYSNNYVSTNGDAIVWSQGAGTTDAYKWAFLGNPIEGVKLINKAAGATKFLQATNPATMAATDHAWTLKRQSNTSWQCGGNGFGLWDETLTYLNTQGSTLKYWGSFDQGSTFWVKDDASEYLPGLTALSQLSNNKAYIITNERATWTVASADATSMSAASFLACDPKQQFAIIKYNNEYYLYNVVEKKFLTSANTFNTVGDPVTITPTENATYPWFFSFDSSHNINVGGSNQVVINSWSTIDQGNSNAIIEVSDFDPAEALSMLQNVKTVTYNLKFAGETVKTATKRVAPGMTPNISDISGWDNGLMTYTYEPATIASNTTVVNINATWNGPFKLSTSYSSAIWHYATIRGTKYLRADDNNKDGSGRYTTSSTNEKTDAYKWAFFGSPYSGFYIANKAQGEGKWLYAGTVPTMQAVTDPASTTEALWAYSTNSDGFTLRSLTGATLYINDAGGAGNLGYWNSSWGATDGGSKWLVEEIPSTAIDVTYNLVIGGQTVKTIVDQAEPNSAVSVPAELTSAYSPLAYEFTTSGTIGSSNCTITVTGTLKAGVITSLDQLSNNKAYLLTTERGTLGSNGTQMVSTNGTSYTEGNFAIINYEGMLFLYSVADSKWVGNPTTINAVGGQPQLTTDLANVTPITFDNTNLAHPLFFMGMGTNGVNVAGGYGTGVVVNGWTTRDGGNQYCIIEAANFDPTAALAALEVVYGNAYDNVAAEILPYIFDDPTDPANSDPETHIGQLFAISSAGAANFVSTYQSQLANRHFTISEYRAAKALFEASMLYPEDGKTYLVKNTYNNNYLRVAQHGTRGQVFADFTAAEAAADIMAQVKVTVINDKPYMSVDGHYFNWTYSNYDGYEAYTVANENSHDKYVHFVSVSPGVGAFSLALGNGEGDYAGDLQYGFYALKNGTTTVGGSTTGYTDQYAQWIFEEFGALKGDVNKDGNVTIADVTGLVNIVLGKDDTEPYQYDHSAADVNGDSNISIADVTALVNKVLGKD